MLTTETHDPVFRANPERRTVSGHVVLWNTPAQASGKWWLFHPGSLVWKQTSRIKLNMGHDREKTYGVCQSIADDGDGLFATFKIARGPDGDEMLSLAEDGVLDGFSIEPGFLPGKEPRPGSHRMPDGSRIFEVRPGAAQLGAVALTPNPAFDDARVTKVAASADRGVTFERRPKTSSVNTFQAAGFALKELKAELDAAFDAQVQRHDDDVVSGFTQSPDGFQRMASKLFAGFAANGQKLEFRAIPGGFEVGPDLTHTPTNRLDGKTLTTGGVRQPHILANASLQGRDLTEDETKALFAAPPSAEAEYAEFSRKRAERLAELRQRRADQRRKADLDLGDFRP